MLMGLGLGAPVALADSNFCIYGSMMRFKAVLVGVDWHGPALSEEKKDAFRWREHLLGKA